jgi:predicted regulator of Ras-like GTPase activity (Roadblock/LC7/MglB family)
MRRFILARYILREHLGPFGFSVALIFLLAIAFSHLSYLLSKRLSLVSPFTAMWWTNFMTGGLGICVFPRFSFGRRAFTSWRPPKWWRRFFESLAKRFRRQRNEHADTIPDQQPREVDELEIAAPAAGDGKADGVAWPALEPVLPEPPRPVTPPANDISQTIAPLEFTPVPEILRHFTNRARADFVLLINCEGVPLAYCKNLTVELPPQTDLEIVAKLAASQIAATQALGGSIGENDRFFSSFQEGEQRNILIYQINQSIIVAALFDKSVVLGAIRLHAHEAVADLQKILDLI